MQNLNCSRINLKFKVVSNSSLALNSQRTLNVNVLIWVPRKKNLLPVYQAICMIVGITSMNITRNIHILKYTAYKIKNLFKIPFFIFHKVEIDASTLITFPIPLPLYHTEIQTEKRNVFIFFLEIISQEERRVIFYYLMLRLDTCLCLTLLMLRALD